MLALLSDANVQKALLVLVCLNIGLTAVKSILEQVEPTPEQQAASKLYQGVAKVTQVLKSIIDWVTANKAH